MERDFLRNFGLEESQVDSILNENSKDIGKKVNEINGLNQTVEKLQADLNTANSTINSLKNSNKDNEDLQSKIAEYKNKITEMQNAFDLERKNNAIVAELQKNDFIDPALAIHLIDSEKVVKANDGTYTGLQEQIDALINNSKYDYLRNIQTEQPEQPAAPPVDRGGYSPEIGSTIDPNAPTPEEKDLIGAVIGREMEERTKTYTQSADEYWESIKL